MKLAELLNSITTTDVSIDVKNIVTNSSLVEEGDVFVAISGVNSDGHDFIEEAISRGAIAVVCEKEVPFENAVIVPSTRKALSIMWANMLSNPAKKLKFLGVTGTNGKTTTAYLVYHILKACGKKAGLIGTVENIIGDRATPSKYTTPEPMQFQKLLTEMVSEGVEYVVMEVSSHALAQHRIDGITFEGAAFTNLTRDHIDYHETMENYKNEKLKLMKMSKRAVVNIDDPSGQEFIDAAEGEAYSYSIDKDSYYKATNMKSTQLGTEFTLISPEGKDDTSIAICGMFSVYNALAAIGLARCAGISQKAVCKALTTATGVAGRMEYFETGKDFTILLDYAHTPDGLLNAVKTIKDLKHGGRLITIFGCGGDRDKQKRPMMGKIATEYSDFVYITSDNPRTEQPQKIIEDIVSGVTTQNYIAITDRKEAMEAAVKNAKSGDILLFAGKGHERYQILSDKTIHFDEREILAEILEKL